MVGLRGLYGLLGALAGDKPVLFCPKLNESLDTLDLSGVFWFTARARELRVAFFALSGEDTALAVLVLLGSAGFKAPGSSSALVTSLSGCAGGAVSEDGVASAVLEGDAFTPLVVGGSCVDFACGLSDGREPAIVPPDMADAWFALFAVLSLVAPLVAADPSSVSCMYLGGSAIAVLFVSMLLDRNILGRSTDTKLALIFETLSPSPTEVRSLVVDDGRSMLGSMPSKTARKLRTVLLGRLFDMTV